MLVHFFDTLLYFRTLPRNDDLCQCLLFWKSLKAVQMFEMLEMTDILYNVYLSYKIFEIQNFFFAEYS